MPLHLPPQPPGGSGHTTTELTQKGNKNIPVGLEGECSAQARHQPRAGEAVAACTAPGQGAQHTWPVLPLQESFVTLLVTEIRSLLGRQARLPLPTVLGGNQALIDLCLTSAFKNTFSLI